jgi:2-desacetyl-2-hydroxyethyl bacteriochlorophyllide A dehydrogenase
MKGICIEEPGKVYVKQDLPMHVCKEGEALIEVKAAGICGSDVAAYKFKHPNCKYPLIIGHETAGVVKEIGENKNGLKVGDRVVLDPYLYCGHCYPCSQGRTNCCEDLHVLGVQTDGSMCEYFTHPADMLVKVPDNLTWEQAAMAEPLTIALHAIHRIELKAGEYMTIFGSGPIGLMAGLVAKAYGGKPIMVDIVDERLEIARNMGLEYTINTVKEDGASKIKEFTNGRMSETVIEASGAEPSVVNALNFAAYTGRIALTGWPKSNFSLPTGIITKKELQIRGSRTSAGEFPEVLNLISSGKIDVKPLISKVVQFDELANYVDKLAKEPGKYLKVIGRL